LADGSPKKLLRNIVAVLVLVPLAVVMIALAVANRQDVTVSLDPFNAKPPAVAVTQPLFVVIFAVLILGVVIGGTASWLRHGKWRRIARRREREASGLRGEIASLKPAPNAPNAASAAEPPPRLKLRPPIG
jgi:uncharacterized integral membrane protein